VGFQREQDVLMNHDRRSSTVDGRAATVERLLQAMAAERRILRELIREHRDLHHQNLELRERHVESGVESSVNNGEAAAIEELYEQTEIRYNLLKSEHTELVNDHQKLLEENNNLFKLYIASHRLHSTLAIGEVLEVISEIVLNLVGADCYALFFYDEHQRLLSPVMEHGIDRGELECVRPGEGAIGAAITAPHNYTIYERQPGAPAADEPLAVVPLKFRNRLLGAIVVYRLLSHKPELRAVDLALFDYFATHAAMAIHSSKLYTESEKKVAKMKEFLNLMQPAQGEGDEADGPAAREENA
jgi:hypothetical protein